MNRFFALILIAVFVSTPAFAARLHPEAWYQERFCAKVNGRAEVTLDDRTRVDCLTEDMAYELDFASKWAEGIGQALHYARKTGRRAGVVLIIEDLRRDIKYIDRVQAIKDHWGFPIDVLTVHPNEFKD